MKLISIVVIIISLAPWPVSGADFIYKEQNGTQHYKCKQPGRVGTSKVVKIGWGVYRVFGPSYRGQVSTYNPAKAARQGCGEINGRQEQPPSGEKEEE